jgi:hypothetical protein
MNMATLTIMKAKGVPPALRIALLPMLVVILIISTAKTTCQAKQATVAEVTMLIALAIGGYTHSILIAPLSPVGRALSRNTGSETILPNIAIAAS